MLSKKSGFTKYKQNVLVPVPRGLLVKDWTSRVYWDGPGVLELMTGTVMKDLHDRDCSHQDPTSAKLRQIYLRSFPPVITFDKHASFYLLAHLL